MCTANNTISIIFTGPLAKNIADQYEIDPRKSASVLDLFSCCVQGLIPYGAQMLTAAGFAALSPVELLPYAFYPILVGVCGIISILIGFPRFSKVAEKKSIIKLHNIKRHLLLAVENARRTFSERFLLFINPFSNSSVYNLFLRYRGYHTLYNHIFYRNLMLESLKCQLL